MAEGNNSNSAPVQAGTGASLSKVFIFRPKEYCASSHGVRSKKIIKRWAHELRSQKNQPSPAAAKKK